MITTVVFDIGRVLIGFEWEDYVDCLFDDDEVKNTVNEATFRGPYWKEMDRGVMDTEDIHSNMVAAAPDCEREILIALERVGECTVRKEYAIPWIQSLKARGYRVLYLSNYSNYVIGKSMHALDFLEHMDGGIMSYQEKCIKPDRTIYDRLFEKYDLAPSECVFIDDSVPNIEAAGKLGMQGVVFENYEQAYRDLAVLLENEGIAG